MNAQQQRAISDPMGALLPHWRKLGACLLLGALVGLGAGLTRPVESTAEARAVVGSHDLAAYQVAGFAAASQQLAESYARYVTDLSVKSEVLRAELNNEQMGRVRSVSSSPIPDSNVLRIEVRATDPKVAVAAASAVTSALIRISQASDRKTPEQLLKEYRAVTQELASQREAAGVVGPEQGKAQAQSEILALRQRAIGAAYQDSVTSPPTQSELELIQPAAVSANSRSRTLQLYGLCGGLVGLTAASGYILAQTRRERPPRVAERTRET